KIRAVRTTRADRQGWHGGGLSSLPDEHQARGSNQDSAALPDGKSRLSRTLRARGADHRLAGTSRDFADLRLRHRGRSDVYRHATDARWVAFRAAGEIGQTVGGRSPTAS